MSGLEKNSGLRGVIVTPGSVVGVVEEFIAGDNIIERNGLLYSTIVGLLEVDMRDRIASVKPIKKIKKLQPGDFVYALVTQTRGELAMARIIGKELINLLPNNTTGLLHISQIPSKTRSVSIDEFVRVGDILYAKIISRSAPYLLSMRSQNASIVVAICPKCGSFMGRLKENLVCPLCGFTEVRSPITKYLYKLSELKKS
ncbi:MAG: exosome complex RNA-binding protein Csl4 [Sulfolobales archaeon]